MQLSSKEPVVFIYANVAVGCAAGAAGEVSQVNANPLIDAATRPLAIHQPPTGRAAPTHNT